MKNDEKTYTEEEKFIKKYPVGSKIEIGIYYSLDDDDNVLIDEDSIIEEFENKLKELLEWNKQ